MAKWCCPVQLISFGWLLALGVILLSPAESQGSTMETLFATLKDGSYQLCTEPDPQDWRDGSGVCLNVVKRGNTLDGYYGYPHSSAFVCLRGQISENWLHGQGLVISWLGRIWQEIPQEEFSWDDQEDRLYLSQGALVSNNGVDDEQVSWIVFQTARLNMQAMYLYDSPRMTSPTQLCDWPFN